LAPGRPRHAPQRFAIGYEDFAAQGIAIDLAAEQVVPAVPADRSRDRKLDFAAAQTGGPDDDVMALHLRRNF
jgi:hypothetical protein